MNAPRQSARRADVFRRPPSYDIVLAALLTAAGVVLLFHPPDDGITYLPADVLGVVTVVATTAPVLFRRSAPLGATIVTAVGLSGFAVWNYSLPISIVVMFVLVYSAAAYASLPRSIVVAGMFLGLALWHTAWLGTVDPSVDSATMAANLTFSAAGLGGMWALGRAVRGRRSYTSELEDRAERLQRARDAEVRAALAEERSRIARELHDVVAHHVSVMTVQAAGARRLVDRDPKRSTEAMAAIEETGRAALTEMRRIVGVLRGPTAPAPDGSTRGDGQATLREGADRAPQPGLADLDMLADQFRQAGLPVQMVIEGTARGIPVGVDLTAFRIVQEALTNTIKHAGPSAATVHVQHEIGVVTVRVSDDGRGIAAALDGRRPGHGLLGMRERVALYGGTLAVGPRRDGGFDVRARIPFDNATAGR